jgi:hypothetical protein
MDFTSLPTPKFPNHLLAEDKCLIDGNEYPQFVGKIIKMLCEGEQPRILILADPGHGKTWCSAWIAELFYNEFDIFQGDFDVEENMKWDPLEFVTTARKARKEIVCHPDANTSFASDEYRSKGNRSNRDIIYLSRRFGNMLIYDAHEMAKCDKTIRTNHNIRIKSIGNADTYKWKAERVIRANDTMKEEIETKPLGYFKSKEPTGKSQAYIESMDDEEKDKKLQNREEEWKEERQKKNAKDFSFA